MPWRLPTPLDDPSRFESESPAHASSLGESAPQPTRAEWVAQLQARAASLSLKRAEVAKELRRKLAGMEEACTALFHDYEMLAEEDHQLALAQASEDGNDRTPTEVIAVTIPAQRRALPPPPQQTCGSNSLVQHQEIIKKHHHLLKHIQASKAALLADATASSFASVAGADDHKATLVSKSLCSAVAGSPDRRVQVPMSRSLPPEPSTPTFAGMDFDSGAEQEPEEERELPE